MTHPAPFSVLFCHKSFPGQFGGIAKYMGSTGHDVHVLTCDERFKDPAKAPKVPWGQVHYVPPPKEFKGEVHRYLTKTQESLDLAEAFQNRALRMAAEGINIDLVCAHSGWGAGSFIPAVWKDAAFVPFLEWWYRFPARDVVQSPHSKDAPQRLAYARVRNLPFLLDCQDADCVLTPTQFQADDHPRMIKDKTVVMHDGIDCRVFSPGVAEGWTPQKDLGLPEGAPILTYATRGMEPARGFPEFMAALEVVQKSNPDVHCVIAGNDSVHYGQGPNDHKTWKAKALAEHSFDMDRLHFVGKLPYYHYRDLLRSSTVHVTLTRPFVLSWSVIQAMATGCSMVVSDTEPMREALPDASQAVHVDFETTSALSATILDLLADPDRRAALSKAARARAVSTYDEALILPRKTQLFASLVAARRAGIERTA